MNQLALPLPPTLAQQCADAKKRIQSFINHSAGQHQRAIRLSFTSNGRNLRDFGVLVIDTRKLTP